MASVHDRLAKVRKPRVHITYQVETEGATVTRELPFVLGVLGDFTGEPNKTLDALQRRKFITVDKDNFNSVMASLGTALNLKVDNTLADDGSHMAVALEFKSLDDFEPAQLVGQVPALKKLLETRNKLRDLMAKADRSEQLETLLERVLQNEADLKSLAASLDKTGKEA